MADRTTNLSMPFILPSQAQKHVTHNEALQMLDAIAQLAIESQSAAPPATPSEGMRYIVAAGATGAWSGHDRHIAAWQDGAWSFFPPREGWLAWFRDAQALKICDGSGWRDLDPRDAALSTLGINATADLQNRLAVAADASLFTHAGHGHQAKINKAAAGDTASLLFQSNWAGFAEMGLAGDNDFSIKVSNTGNWLTALKIRQNGTVQQPQRPMGRAYRNDGNVTPPADSESGFAILDQVHGGITLGSTLPNGNRTLKVPVDGPYLLSFMTTCFASSGHTTSLFRNRGEVLFTLWAPSLAPLTLSHTQVAMLSAGDELSVWHTGTAQLYNAAGLTQLTAVML
jgi:hypothetical protein